MEFLAAVNRLAGDDNGGISVGPDVLALVHCPASRQEVDVGSNEVYRRLMAETQRDACRTLTEALNRNNLNRYGVSFPCDDFTRLLSICLSHSNPSIQECARLVQDDVRALHERFGTTPPPTMFEFLDDFGGCEPHWRASNTCRY